MSCSSSSSAIANNNQDSTIHLLPCTIDFNGPAPVSSYFRIKSEQGVLTSHFRGRKLRGIKVPLPEATTGVCVTKVFNSETQKPEWEITEKFNAITDWQHDTTPSTNHLEEYFDWFELAESVRDCK